MNTENLSSESETGNGILGAVSRSPLSKEDEEKRQIALKKANDAYYDKNSPHYKDNERFSWAVETINKSFFEDCD